ncbi:MAG: helix-turn-helix transcriptional regulator [Thermodesulfobacteriota bacterium]|nr:helix-turn-helix transcriptional regulator [Thermodesulfobacteriota bacterium]
MLAVVKKPHTNSSLFKIKGDIPAGVLKYLRREFGQDVEVIDEDEELLNIFETEWYQEIKEATTPGEILMIYRNNFGLTQTDLGQKLGKFTRQKISDMEHNKRSISKDIAKKLSRLFDVPVDRC